MLGYLFKLVRSMLNAISHTLLQNSNTSIGIKTIDYYYLVTPAKAIKSTMKVSSKLAMNNASKSSRIHNYIVVKQFVMPLWKIGNYFVE